MYVQQFNEPHCKELVQVVWIFAIFISWLTQMRKMMLLFRHLLGKALQALLCSQTEAVGFKSFGVEATNTTLVAVWWRLTRGESNLSWPQIFSLLCLCEKKKNVMWEYIICRFRPEINKRKQKTTKKDFLTGGLLDQCSKLTDINLSWRDFYHPSLQLLPSFALHIFNPGFSILTPP